MCACCVEANHSIKVGESVNYDRTCRRRITLSLLDIKPVRMRTHDGENIKACKIPSPPPHIFLHTQLDTIHTSTSRHSCKRTQFNQMYSQSPIPSSLSLSLSFSPSLSLSLFLSRSLSLSHTHMYQLKPWKFQGLITIYKLCYAIFLLYIYIYIYI